MSRQLGPRAQTGMLRYVRVAPSQCGLEAKVSGGPHGPNRFSGGYSLMALLPILSLSAQYISQMLRACDIIARPMQKMRLSYL